MEAFEAKAHLVGVPAHRQAILQVIEGELLVRHVGDVARILLAALIRVEVFLDDADRETEGLVERARGFGVAFNQVVVDRHDM